MPITKATASSIAPAAKGDLVVGSATNDAAVLGVGSNDQVLTADSSTATGLKWASAASGGANWSLLNSGGTALTGSNTVTVSGISGKDKIMVIVDAGSASAGGYQIGVRFNSDGGNNYHQFGVNLDSGASPIFGPQGLAYDWIILGDMPDASNIVDGYVLVTGCNASGVKVFNSAATANGSSGRKGNILGGYYNSSSTISSVNIIIAPGANLDAGTVYVYTSA